MIYTTPQCKVIGHRGACGYAPENTISSFKKAIEFGVDMIEFDVHVCASGELVVMHDDSVDRMTSGSGYIKEKTYAQLRELTVGTHEHIPTLKEAIESIGKSVKIAIELKGPGTAIPTARILQEYIAKGWPAEHFYILSFDHVQLYEFYKIIPQIKRCATIYGTMVGLSQYAQEYGFNAIATSYEYATEKFVNDAHKHGLHVFVYTVNDPHIIKQLLFIGVDGIVSDYPDRVQTEVQFLQDTSILSRTPFAQSGL